MDESEYRKIRRRYNIVGCVVVLTPCLLLALFFNFHTWIADLSGTYKFICVDFHDSKILYYALPKLSNQCGYISVVRQFDIVPPVHWDLIIALDLAILAVPFLTSIYFIIDYKAQRLVMIQPYLRRASGIKYYRVRLTVYLLVGLSTSCWFVLFAPIEVSMPIEVSTSSDGPFHILLVCIICASKFLHRAAYWQIWQIMALVFCSPRLLLRFYRIL